jgi:3-(3-hydroxy-phenyl)propionate hydroxylase
VNAPALQQPYRRSPDQDAAAPVHHPVVVVGAGPVGLSLAIDLAQRLQSSGQRVLLLAGDGRLSSGSRAICFAQRTLQVWDTLGVGDAAVAAGVGWNVGRVFLRSEPVYRFDLLPEPGHERPAFINLSQTVAEALLVQRAQQLPNLDMRWQHSVTALQPGAEAVLLTVQTPEGDYGLQAGYVAACDGARSPLRGLLGLESSGRVFRDRFLIADVHIDGELFDDGSTERWFWFDPPFHPGQSVLLHRQPEGVWRIDFQLGWDADPDTEQREEHVVPRVQALLRTGFGREVPFRLVWASVYTFGCRRMAHFRPAEGAGRVLFAGDNAHGVSPFGARGANSGVQDADNLGWKLAAVLQGRAPATLLDSYAHEREAAADENIAHSTRATDFITPKSAVSRLFRDATLALARDHAFARRLVNSGRLSTATHYARSALNTPDNAAPDQALAVGPAPGSPAPDAPLQRRGHRVWLLRERGTGFTLLHFGAAPDWPLPAGVALLCVDGDTLADPGGLAAQRYAAAPGSAYLLRPDGHVAARWKQPTSAAVHRALQRALGHDATEAMTA